MSPRSASRPLSPYSGDDESRVSPESFSTDETTGDKEVVSTAVSMDLATELCAPDTGGDLVARARRGDAAAIESLTRTHLPQVERMLYRILGPRKDIEDLVQNVFLEMCRVLPRFRGDSTFSTFLGGITVHVARRAMRPTAWQRRRADLADEEAGHGGTPEQEVADRERMRRLRRALDGLSDNHRIAFSLWAFEGTDPATIAELTGATLSATRSRIFYAQKYLRQAAERDPWLSEWLGGTDDEPR